jgi:hypothetical protein
LGMLRSPFLFCISPAVLGIGDLVAAKRRSTKTRTAFRLMPIGPPRRAFTVSLVHPAWAFDTGEDSLSIYPRCSISTSRLCGSGSRVNTDRSCSHSCICRRMATGCNRSTAAVASLASIMSCPALRVLDPVESRTKATALHDAALAKPQVLVLLARIPRRRGLPN